MSTPEILELVKLRDFCWKGGMAYTPMQPGKVYKVWTLVEWRGKTVGHYKVEAMLVDDQPCAIGSWVVGPQDFMGPEKVVPFPLGAVADIDWTDCEYFSRSSLLWPDEWEFPPRAPS